MDHEGIVLVQVMRILDEAASFNYVAWKVPPGLVRAIISNFAANFAEIVRAMMGNTMGLANGSAFELGVPR